MKYTQNCKKMGILPTIEELATLFDVGVRTIYDWEESHLEFSHTIQQLRETQKHLLINNALTGKYNARFATFLLKASHGYKENEPIVTTNENFMNISPDVLADALKLMKSST
jgi:basic membrane lipoprotein Med (substrate-binding protein (PBP1-ABC) superfamily)